MVRWLGHDAIIFPGNSGGPLLDQHGLIIGINEVGIGSLGGAIPSNLAKKIADELAKTGFVSRSWTGLECQPVLDSNKRGILVAGVIENSPAQTAGLVAGDRIIKYNGKKVDVQIPEDLPVFNQYAYGIEPGRTVSIEGFRNQKKKQWKLKTQLRESAFSKEIEIKSWGITVRNLTLMSARI